MRGYDLVKDFLQSEQGQGDNIRPDCISTSPGWVLACIRLKYPLTYSRGSRASFTSFFPTGVETRGKTLIISSDCQQLQTQSAKTSHLTQLSAQLLPGETNYLSEIMPGDYLVGWCCNDQERLDSLIDRIRKGQSCNKFMDGLKFFGKVHSLHKNLQQDPGGPRSVRYSLQAVGFSEFDATLFYDPHLAEKITTIGRYMGRLASSLNQLVTERMIDVNRAIPFFVDLLLGQGVAANLGRGNSDPSLRSTAGLEGDYSYIIPQEFGALIGKTVTSKSGGALAYADVLELQVGVQDYSRDRSISDYERGVIEESNPNADTDSKQRAGIFTPDGPIKGSRRFTDLPMMGRFLPTPPQFAGASVWSILNQYLNSACNEMYSCLRTNGEGSVVPTLVVRQLPFSSSLVKVPFHTTKFLDLPRWRVHPILVRQAQLGRSDSLRFNFINVQGLAPIDKTGLTSQLVRNPPFRDDLDIARSGLRNYSATIPCALDDIKVKTGETAGSTAASNWMDLLADILMGQHLTLTGSLTLVGIQAPICCGDNLEWDGVCFHIESVSHNCVIQGDGRKSFSTTLTLSHGVRTQPGQEDLGLYAGIKTQDQMSFNPPVTDEGRRSGNSSEEFQTPTKVSVSSLPIDIIGRK